jgi:hypothetical protein
MWAMCQTKPEAALRVRAAGKKSWSGRASGSKRHARSAAGAATAARRSPDTACRKVASPACLGSKLAVTNAPLRRGVAQTGSAPALGAGCRVFKSPRPDQLFQWLTCKNVGHFLLKKIRGTSWGTKSKPVGRGPWDKASILPTAVCPEGHIAFTRPEDYFSCMCKFTIAFDREDDGQFIAKVQEIPGALVF